MEKDTEIETLEMVLPPSAMIISIAFNFLTLLLIRL